MSGQKPMIIVITGIDGSGKTTQVDYLSQKLKSYNLEIKVVSHFSMLPVIKEIVNISKEDIKKIEKKSSKIENSKNNQVKRSLNYVKDFVFSSRIMLSGLLRFYYRYLLFKNEEILIFDRYFYDDLIKINWMYNLDYNKENLVGLVPDPDIIFYLTIEPSKAWKRETDDDITIKGLKEKSDHYECFFKNLKNTHKISTSKSIQTVSNRIFHILNQKLEIK